MFLQAIQLQNIKDVKTQLLHLKDDEINNQIYAGQMPIHLTCQLKNMAILKLLLEYNAKVSVNYVSFHI